jgi:hypothetical protein
VAVAPTLKHATFHEVLCPLIVYTNGRIIVQSDRTNSGTADGTRMMAPGLDSKAPTTT